jgi:hypothetical protein
MTPVSSCPAIAEVSFQIAGISSCANTDAGLNCAVTTNVQVVATTAKPDKKTRSRELSRRKLAKSNVADHSSTQTAMILGSTEPKVRGRER